MTARVSCLLATLPLLACVAGCSSGCVASEHPLSDEKTSILDRRFLGIWEVVEENPDRKPGRVAIEPKPESDFSLVIKPADPSDKGPPIEAIATDLGKRRYLSVRGLEQPKEHDWGLFQYEWLDDNSLRVRPMDPKVVADEVKSNLVKGRIKERAKKTTEDDGKNQAVADDVRLEEPTARLREYVEKSGDKLFGKEWMTFRRIEPK